MYRWWTCMAWTNDITSGVKLGPVSVAVYRRWVQTDGATHTYWYVSVLNLTVWDGFARAIWRENP